MPLGHSIKSFDIKGSESKGSGLFVEFVSKRPDPFDPF